MLVATVVTVAIVAVDLAANPARRASWVARLGEFWPRLRTPGIRATLRGVNEAAEQAMQRLFGQPGAYRRLVLGIILFTTLLTIASLVFSILLMQAGWPGVVERWRRYYAIPTFVAGACSLALLRLFLARAWRWRSVWRLGAGLLGLAVAALLLWILAMHAGTWHEWQYRRSPLEFASAWFYAEVYQEYFETRLGAAVSLTLALAVLVPQGIYYLMVICRMTLRVAAPVLAPSSLAAAGLFRRLPRGAAGLTMLLILLGWLSVVVVHVGSRIGDETISIRHLDLGQ